MPATRVVLIHASGDDVHARAVEKRLQELAVGVHVLIREACFKDWNIACEDDTVVVETAEGDRYLSDNIRAVCWRKDYIVEPSWMAWEGLTPPVAEFLADQRAIHVESTFKRLARSTPFLNDINANRSCSSKPTQHHVARRCGLSVPATYFGSDPVQAERFVRELWRTGRRCCTKNIESTHVEIDGVKHARLTRLFLEEHLSELPGLAVCPMIFQEYVEKRYEYRVTVVGQEVYACRIDSQSAGGETAIDWRHYNIPSTPHFAAELDRGLQDRLIKLVHELGLTYGAVDLVENPDGEFFFLEVNSMGQWLWIEDLTELPISMAIARHLADPHLIRR